MPDICIDVPAAYTVLEKMGDKMYQLGVLSEAQYKDPTSKVLEAVFFWSITDTSQK